MKSISSAIEVYILWTAIATTTIAKYHYYYEVIPPKVEDTTLAT